MTSVFIFCAILGTAFTALQFIAVLVGFGGGDLDGDGIPDAVEADAFDASGDVADGGDSGGVFLKALSLRTLTAGVAFFGLAGLGAESLGAGTAASTLAASVVGAAAIYAVYLLLRLLSSFSADGSIRESEAVNASGSVYLRVPPRRSGQGKAVVTQQGRLVEYAAVTDDEDGLPTGTPIVVVKLLAPGTALVARYLEKKAEENDKF